MCDPENRALKGQDVRVAGAEEVQELAYWLAHSHAQRHD